MGERFFKNDWVKDKKLTKANSYMANDTIFYVAKKDKHEKAAGQYWAYLYPQGIVVMGKSDKKELLQWLDDNVERIEAQISGNDL